MRTIIIEPYNPEWPAEFQRLRDFLWPHVADLALDIVHIGSTSVPGLAAKPILDFNIVIDSYDVFPQLTERLAALGYRHDGDGGLATRERFDGGPRDGFMEYYLYVSPKTSPILDAQLLFRDALRKNDSARDEYAALKRALAEQHRHDIISYVDGKHEFIMRIATAAYNERSNAARAEP